MSRRRRHPGMDLTYADAHRNALPELYGRIGHRLNVCDRDWTEFCHYCRDPLALLEEMRDDGRDLNDKSTKVTERLACLSDLPALLFAWQVDRPEPVQRRIDALHREIRQLEAAHPIVGFRARELRPERTPVVQLSPAEWWQRILILHRDHHRTCPHAKQYRVNGPKLLAAKAAHPLHTLTLFDFEAS